MRLRLLTGFALVLLTGAAMSGVVTARADISGAWNFTWTTDGGVRESTIEFVQKEDRLKATTDKQVLEGSIKDDVFEVKGDFYSAQEALPTSRSPSTLPLIVNGADPPPSAE